jgi:hypothetical protein
MFFPEASHKTPGMTRWLSGVAQKTWNIAPLRTK